MPRMAPITEDNCCTERMRPTTSLRRSVTDGPCPDERAHGLDQLRPRRVVACPLGHDLRYGVGRERVELGRDPPLASAIFATGAASNTPSASATSSAT